MTASPVSTSRFANQQALSLQQRLEGTTLSRILLEFVSTSALFPILDAIRVVTAEGWVAYLVEPSHYMLIAATLVQAWFLGTSRRDSWQEKFVGNLLGLALYAPLDMMIEGMGFFREPYHWLFAAFSLVMAILSALQVVAAKHSAGWHTLVTLLLNVSKVALFPAMYFITEQQLASYSQLTWAAWQEYMLAGGHQFIVYGTLFFGALLGLAEAQRLNFVSYLQAIARRLNEYSEWSLDTDLINTALDTPEAMDLRRVEKTIMFMDIRGFTAWSEQADPKDVVAMLNHYYTAAEKIISRHHGHKPNLTADEMMSRFVAPDDALETAQELQQTLGQLLQPYHLAVGIGLHTGEIIEGLMGSETTRKYDIIGDVVNTAKRLESAAGRGEILLSATTYQKLSMRPPRVSFRSLQVKGKSQPMQAAVIAQSLVEG